MIAEEEFNVRLERVRALIFRLSKDSPAPASDTDVRGLIFTRPNLGGLQLYVAERKFYMDVLAKLVEVAAPVGIHPTGSRDPLEDRFFAAAGDSDGKAVAAEIRDLQLVLGALHFKRSPLDTSAAGILESLRIRDVCASGARGNQRNNRQGENSIPPSA